MSEFKHNFMYFAYWDCYGFECLTEIGSYERQRMFDDISGKEPAKNPVNTRFWHLRALFNPQRNPEIWIFSSEVGPEDIQEISRSDPQHLVNLIRLHGTCLTKFSTTKEAIIK